MAPKTLQDKKRKRSEDGSSKRVFDASKLRSNAHDKRYHEIVEKKNISQEKAYNLKADQFPTLEEEKHQKWQTVTAFPIDSTANLAKEFHKKNSNDINFLSFVGGKKFHCEREELILQSMQPTSAACITRQGNGKISPTHEQQLAVETSAQELPGESQQPPPSLEQRLMLIERTQTQLQQNLIRLELGQARIEQSLQSMSHLLELIYRSQQHN
ncbi:hypothetical protein VNO78_24200 [Psophocarpus tetragonolobus]|uniref:Uncharacterized protein n=1 Tax=Psophocarpus tetragonolobus TaxID=3891 RepID=A0AAN9S807_PSOTE